MAARLGFFGMAIASLLLIAACGANPDPSPPPTVISHLDISQKKTLIDRTRSTLEIFHGAAVDLRQRGDRKSRSEFSGQVARFMSTRVAPLVHDFEAASSLETRLQIAELQLLGAMVYLELGENRRAVALLEEMELRYRDRPEILKVALERNRFGFRNLDEGIRGLRERLYGARANLPGPPLF